jgi:hypothetical protein
MIVTDYHIHPLLDPFQIVIERERESERERERERERESASFGIERDSE